jgi:diguanylate cyclase (GGDEF)-like protein
MKVLIADDCTATLEILSKSLREWGYEPTLVTDGKEALRLLRSPQGPRLAILDWSMPLLEGTTVCREIRNRQEEQINYTYLIVLTARDGAESTIEALESGADDFLSKPFNVKELEQRVRAGKRIVELQDRLLRTNRRLAVVATHDQLTGALNRSATMQRLSEEIERSVRNNRHVSFLTLDVDRFAVVNEWFGYQAGDDILRQIADRFKGALHSYDSVGRVGGEEFSVVLPEIDLGHAVAVAERLRGSIQNQSFIVDGETIELTVSVGVASTSTAGYDRRSLVGGAERALQEAQASGQNCMMMCDAEGRIIDPLNSEQESC